MLTDIENNGYQRNWQGKTRIRKYFPPPLIIVLVIRMKFNCVKYLPWSQKILTEPALVKLVMDQLSRVRTNKLATIMTITMNVAREFQNHKVNPNLHLRIQVRTISYQRPKFLFQTTQ